MFANLAAKAHRARVGALAESVTPPSDAVAYVGAVEP